MTGKVEYRVASSDPKMRGWFLDDDSIETLAAHIKIEEQVYSNQVYRVFIRLSSGKLFEVYRNYKYAFAIGGAVFEPRDACGEEAVCADAM